LSISVDGVIEGSNVNVEGTSSKRLGGSDASKEARRERPGRQCGQRVPASQTLRSKLDAGVEGGGAMADEPSTGAAFIEMVDLGLPGDASSWAGAL
jgi:hypothetical protein